MKLRDLKDQPEAEKKKFRIWSNDALAARLDNEKVKYKRKPVRDYLNDDSIPAYEIGIVVGNKHVNYHNNGFHGGQDGKDDPSRSHMSIDAAVAFLT